MSTKTAKLSGRASRKPAGARAPRIARVEFGQDGVFVCYENVCPRAMIDAGLLTPDLVPPVGSTKAAMGGKCIINTDTRSYALLAISVRRRADGKVDAMIDAALLRGRDTAFKRFVARLLADADLSLVRDERPGAR